MAELNRAILQKLAIMRLEDARALLRLQRYSAAYYLAGYSVECGLKACIAKQTKRHSFPDKDRVNKSYSHRLAELAALAKPIVDLEAQLVRDARFKDFWLVTEAWSEQKWYEIISRGLARDMFRAISDADHGVLRWLRESW